MLGVLLNLIYDITGATTPGLDGSISILPEWVHIAASILFAFLIVLAFTRKYAGRRTNTDADADPQTAVCSCGSCRDTDNES